MEYTLRRYEAIQRLVWFVFFLACLLFAYPLTSLYQVNYQGAPVLASINPDILKTPEFWAQRFWLGLDPLGKIILYLFWVAALFLLGKIIWLLAQYFGKYLVKSILSETIKNVPGRSKASLEDISNQSRKLFSSEMLTKRMKSVPFRFLFHPFQRLRLMLAHSHRILSSEDLTEKERRVVETDWQVLWSSWAPFRWLLWLLPLLAFIQTCFLFYLQLMPLLTEQKEINDLLGPLTASLLPLVQVIAVIIILNLVSGLLKRIENLYLSNVDALFYDHLVSRVPFQSSDTIVILEALQRHFKELQALLRRSEADSLNEADRGGEQK